jgi:Fe-S cluster biosynthesis and repair protein YggX
MNFFQNYLEKLGLSIFPKLPGKIGPVNISKTTWKNWACQYFQNYLENWACQYFQNYLEKLGLSIFPKLP